MIIRARGFGAALFVSRKCLVGHVGHPLLPEAWCPPVSISLPSHKLTWTLTFGGPGLAHFSLPRNRVPVKFHVKRELLPWLHGIHSAHKQAIGCFNIGIALHLVALLPACPSFRSNKRGRGEFEPSASFRGSRGSGHAQSRGRGRGGSGRGRGCEEAAS